MRVQTAGMSSVETMLYIYTCTCTVHPCYNIYFKTRVNYNVANLHNYSQTCLSHHLY